MQASAKQEEMLSTEDNNRSKNAANIMNSDEKSHTSPPASIPAIIEAENADEEHHYIVGWRLYLLTFRYSIAEIN